MVRPDEELLHAARDIRRAYLLIGRLRGLDADDSAAALQDHAALTGTSLHAAARAVLAEWRPLGVGDTHRPPVPRADTTSASGRILLRWRGRDEAHVAVSGPRNDDLAARLRRAVEKALRAGARHLVVDTRGTSGAAPEFDDVLAWAGRRLWARQGSLVLRPATAPRDDTSDPGSVRASP